MPRTQLAINCPAPLLERLRAAATERGTTVTTLVLAWVEAGLDAPRSGLDPSRSAPRPDLDQRLDAVERRLDALDAPAPAKPASPKQVTAPSPARLVAAPQAGDSITTAELAELLGMKRGSFNERLRRGGGARVGLVMEGWRCVGQSAPPEGGPLRWLWELAV